MFWPSRDFTSNKKNLGMAHKLCRRQASIQEKGAQVVLSSWLDGLGYGTSSSIQLWMAGVKSVRKGTWMAPGIRWNFFHLWHLHRSSLITAHSLLIRMWITISASGNKPAQDTFWVNQLVALWVSSWSCLMHLAQVLRDWKLSHWIQTIFKWYPYGIHATEVGRIRWNL